MEFTDVGRLPGVIVRVFIEFTDGYNSVKGIWEYILEVTVISVVNFLITCLVSEILKDKDTNHPPSWIFKKSMTS